jgi:hypothetical protein
LAHNTSKPDEVLDCLSQGGVAWSAQDYVTAKQHANEALELAQRQKHVHGELGALHLLANIAFNQCEDKASRELHERVKTRSLEVGFWEGAASSLTNLALIDIVDSNLSAARDKYQQAIGLYETISNVEMVEIVRAILSKEKIEAVLDGIPRIPAAQK